MRTPSATEGRPPTILYKLNVGLRSFSDLEVPDGTQRAIFSDNVLTDFVGLEPSTALTHLVLDRNPVISFRGFPALPGLKVLSLVGSPLSELPNFRALAIICAGTQLANLNGTEVTPIDLSSAVPYGPAEHPRSLLIRGWLPRKPINLSPVSPKRPSGKAHDKEQAKRDPEENSRVLQTVARQEGDPLSLQIVRLLRTIGYGNAQIRQFFRRVFSPAGAPRPEAKTAARSPLQRQIDNQQLIIDTLATEIEVLRSGNRLLNQYEEMIRTVGAPLFRNAEELEAIERGDGRDGIEKADGAAGNYAELRQAVLEFLGVDPGTLDEELVAQINSSIPSDDDDAAQAVDQPTAAGDSDQLADADRETAGDMPNDASAPIRSPQADEEEEAASTD
jgi:hypothetical protein